MDNYLIHHGILGQKWGVRRYQNADGSLTNEGRKHYNSDSNPNSERKTLKAKGEPRRMELTDEQKVKVKKALKVGATAVGIGLAAYGSYKLASNNPEITKFVRNGKRQLSLEFELAEINAVNSYRRLSKSVPEKMSKVSKEAKKQAVNFAKDTAKSAAKNLKNSAVEVAISSLSVAAIKKIDSSISENTGDSVTDMKNKIIKNAAKQTVNDAANNARSGFRINTKNNTNGGNNSQPSMSQGKIESIIGSKPKGHDMVDNNTPEWGNLLNSVPKEKKQVIKDARRLGYDWSELQILASRL